ncbi:hypothetical protein [Paraflavitalea sp. CAU 1676]|uniref:hypothetical protein n=1 Tax=Paraflavitalea sp. CAU 1676 TaxID=3032598 RepID=UPI0023DADD06|nr:hypothetical protein [Paraflavitalea sp. CAU 1676]MDF2192503.1 hypothetical protein [Paraflavitalea sp. CAU 1676]
MLDPVIQNSTPADNRKLLAVAIASLAILHLVEFALHGRVPERIGPGEVKINISGLILLVSNYVVFLFTFKKALKDSPQVRLIYLLVFGCLIVFFAEIICQTVRLGLEQAGIGETGGLRGALVSILGQPLCSLMVSVPLAIELRYKNKLLATLIFFAIGFLAWYLFIHLGLLEDLRSLL